MLKKSKCHENSRVVTKLHNGFPITTFNIINNVNIDSSKQQHLQYK